MNWINFADALLLEVGFGLWSGHMYDTFAQGGDLNGMGTPREAFMQLELPENWHNWQEFIATRTRH